MAKRRAAVADDITLYDIDPAFQDKLIVWLSKKPHGIVVDIGSTPEAFTVTLDPGGVFLDESFEHVLSTEMGLRSKTKRIDPELEHRVHTFLQALNAHLTFGASKDGVFNMTISNDIARGAASDEDFEIALVFAEEAFWANMPEKPLPLAQRAALAEALVPAAQREAEREAQVEEMLPPGMAKWAARQPTLSLPPRQLPPAPKPAKKPKPSAAPASVSTSLGPTPSWFVPKAVREEQAAEERREAAKEMLPPGMHGLVKNKRRPPPPPSSKPFDPEAPREHYASSHHFAVNDDLQENRRLSYEQFHDAVVRVLDRGGVSHPLDVVMANEDEIGFAYREGRSVDSTAGDLMRARWRRDEDYNENARWTRAYVNSLPDSAFLHVEPGGDKDEHGRSHPLSLRHLPYKNRAGAIDQAHLKNALARVHQEGTRLPKHVKDTVFKKAQAIYEREFGHAADMAANASGAWRIHLAGGDVARGTYADFDEAATEARRMYGPSGWAIEWHAR